jgi:hypothetical protein
MHTGAANRAGRLRVTCAKASTPPIEAPMTTIRSCASKRFDRFAEHSQSGTAFSGALRPCFAVSILATVIFSSLVFTPNSASRGMQEIRVSEAYEKTLTSSLRCVAQHFVSKIWVMPSERYPLSGNQINAGKHLDIQPVSSDICLRKQDTSDRDPESPAYAAIARQSTAHRRHSAAHSWQ